MNYGIGNVKGKGGVSNTMLTTTTDATENSGTYTLDLTYLSETPKVNDYVVYVNSGNLTTLYQVSAVGSTNATLTKVGDIGGGKQLYQHILFIGGTIGSTYVYGQTLIINDSPLPLVKPSDYVEGTNQKLSKWLYDNDFKDGADSANAYNFFTQYISSANRFGLFSTDGDELKVWKGTSGGFTAEALTPTDIRDKVKPL